MLNQVKAIVSNSVNVEVKDNNQYKQYPVVVTDIAADSITNGWALTYYPRLMTKGNARLYDGKEAFSALTITNFKNLYERLMAVDTRFASGDAVIVGNNNQRTAVYEIGDKARFHVRQFKDSITISLSITDPVSPFHMLAINFRIVNSKKEQGKRHLIGSESQWDLTTDTFVEHNAVLSPNKKKYLQVFQEDNNTIPYVKAPSRPGINNTTQVDPDNSEFLFHMDIDNEFRALAFIYEQAILTHALAIALPIVQAKSSVNTSVGAPFSQLTGFGTSDAPSQTGFGQQAAQFSQQSFGGQAPFAPQQQQQQQTQGGFQPAQQQMSPAGNAFMQKPNWGDNDRAF